MKKTLILFSALFFLLLASPITYSQVTTDSSLLSLDRIFHSREFMPEYFGGYQWLGDGEYYTALERSDSVKGGMDIKKIQTKTGKKTLLVNAESLIMEGTDKPLRWSDYSWSDDQSKILFFTNSRRVWRANTRGDYWVYTMKSGKLVQLGMGLPEASLMFAKFTKDAQQVAYVSQHDIYMEDLASGEIIQLTFDGTEDIINGTFDWVYEEELSCRDGFRWSADGRYIAFWQLDASEIKDFMMINYIDSLYSSITLVQYPKAGEDPSAAKVGYIDTQSKKISWIDIPGDPKQHYLPRMQWVGDKHLLLIQQLNRHQNENKLWSYNLDDGRLNNFHTEHDDAWVDVDFPDIAQAHWGMSDLPFLSNQHDFIWFSESDGWRHLYKKSISNDNEILLTPGDFDVASYYGIDEKRGYLYFNASPDNSTQRYLYRVNLDGSGDLTRLTSDDKPGINRYSFSPGMQFAIESSSALNRIPTKDLIAYPKNKIVRSLVTNEAYAKKIAGLKLGQTEFFKVTTAEGVEMDGYMVKPPDFDPSKKYPVLFDLYGEPWSQTAVDSWGSLWHYMLAQKGYIVITMDNRGTPCLKGREWRKSIYKKIGVLNSGDQAAATREILKWNFVDPDRIAVWGWSGGGSMTLNLMFRYPEIYKTGMAVAAVANLRYYDNIYQERYTGIPQENPEVYTEGSPITYAKNLEGNLLVIHGTADDNVHFQNAEALIRELVEYNKQFDLMIYPNCSHGIYEIPGARMHLYTLLTNYLMEHVEAGGK